MKVAWYVVFSLGVAAILVWLRLPAFIVGGYLLIAIIGLVLLIRDLATGSPVYGSSHRLGRTPRLTDGFAQQAAAVYKEWQEFAGSYSGRPPTLDEFRPWAASSFGREWLEIHMDPDGTLRACSSEQEQLVRHWL